MTDEKKPAGMSYEAWIDKVIREAQERGEFEKLPGAGKPIGDLEAVYDPDWWVKQKLRGEGISAAPEPLRLRGEADALIAGLPTLRSESAVREQVRKINALLAKANTMPAPAGLAPRALLDEEAEVARFRRDG